MERGMNLGNISYADRCIAHNDELSIENELIGLKGLGAEWALKTAGECADALRRIDALKFSGEYENERARLKAIIEDNTPQETKERDKVFQEKIAAWSNSLEFSDFRKHYSNFLAGCQSPDPEQKARFRSMAQALAIGDKTPAETALALLRNLERVKGRKGRPPACPRWRNENHLLEEMRNMCCGGASVTEAARAVAEKVDRAGADRANDLAKLYRCKMRLRE